MSLIGDSVIGASPQAIEFVAGLAFQLESLCGNAAPWLCPLGDGEVNGV